MALPVVIAKNQTGTDIFLPRIGLTVPASGQLTLTDFSHYYEVGAEEELQTQVTAGDIVINDGTNDLSTAEALSFLDFTGNMNGPTSGSANALVKLTDSSGKYTTVTGVTVDASNNISTAGNVEAATITTGGTPLTLNELGDVTITGAAQGDVLMRNGSEWVNLAAGLSGQVLQTNGGASNPTWVDNAGATALGGSWRFSSTTTAADPGSRNFRFNNATQGSATELYISDISESGVDTSTILANIPSGTRVYLQDERDATKYHLIHLTSTGTDNTGWFTFTITVEDSGLDLVNNDRVGFLFFIIPGAAAATTLQDAYDNGNSITTASSTDIAFTLTSGDFTTQGGGLVAFGNTTEVGSFSVFSAGTLTLQSRDTTLLDMQANNAAARTLTVSASNAGAGAGNIAITADDAIDIDSGAALSLNSSGGVINIGDDAVAQNINVGTGAAARTISIGNTTGATQIDLAAGTGHTNVTTGMTWNGTISPTSLAADQNDYSPTNLSTATVIRQGSSVDVSITGLAGGAAGRIIVITNIGANTITLPNEDTNSTAVNRFLFGGDFIRIFPNDSLILQYDGTSSRWRAPATSRGTVAGEVKTVFTQFGSNSATAKGEHNTVSIGSNGSLNLEARIPSDYNSLIQIAAVMIPSGTNAAASIDLASTYGAQGEVFNQHAETDTTQTYSLVADQITYISAATVATQIAADDYIGILFDHNGIGGNSFYLGIILTYT